MYESSINTKFTTEIYRSTKHAMRTISKRKTKKKNLHNLKSVLKHDKYNTYGIHLIHPRNDSRDPNNVRHRLKTYSAVHRGSCTSPEGYWHAPPAPPPPPPTGHVASGGSRALGRRFPVGGERGRRVGKRGEEGEERGGEGRGENRRSREKGGGERREK